MNVCDPVILEMEDPSSYIFALTNRFGVEPRIFASRAGTVCS